MNESKISINEGESFTELHRYKCSTIGYETISLASTIIGTNYVTSQSFGNNYQHAVTTTAKKLIGKYRKTIQSLKLQVVFCYV